MAPEVISGRSVLASDLYSLGMTLATLLTGLGPDDLVSHGAQIDISRIENTSPAFLDWLKRMTEIDLDSRYPSAEEALDVLKQISSDTKLSELT